MTTANRTLRAHLRAITDGERLRTVRVLLRSRAVVATIYAGFSAWLGIVQGQADWRVSVPLFAAYSVVSLLIVLATIVRPGLLARAAFGIGLIDVVVICSASYLAMPDMEEPRFLLSSALPFLSLVVILATLALDYFVIASASVSAAVGAGMIVRAVGGPWSEVIVPAFVMLALGGTAAFLVSRLRALVEESRRKDFAGKYVLGARLGIGGMAEVFSATYSPEGSFERQVAVKRVLPAYAERADFIAMFRREAELGAQLAHPNLVQVLDFGRHLDSWFIAMEFVDGVTLAMLLRNSGLTQQQLPVAAALYVVAEVAEALTYLHEKRAADGSTVGLVHRDLNPPNVLISKGGEVKVSDFGIARWETGSSELTQAGTVRGKTGYMAPEYLGGSPPSPMGDLFALGVIAHEILTGQRLYSGLSDLDLARSVLESVVQPPLQGRSSVSATVDTLVMGLLESNPARRVSSAREVTRVLRGLTGPDAPYPGGRQALIAVVTTTDVTQPAATTTRELRSPDAVTLTTIGPKP